MVKILSRAWEKCVLWGEKKTWGCCWSMVSIKSFEADGLAEGIKFLFQSWCCRDSKCPLSQLLKLLSRWCLGGNPLSALLGLQRYTGELWLLLLVRAYLKNTNGQTEEDSKPHPFKVISQDEKTNYALYRD